MLIAIQVSNRNWWAEQSIQENKAKQKGVFVSFFKVDVYKGFNYGWFHDKFQCRQKNIRLLRQRSIGIDWFFYLFSTHPWDAKMNWNARALKVFMG